jgi:hypothetical protein
VDIREYNEKRKVFQQIFDDAIDHVEELLNCEIMAYRSMILCNDIHSATSIYWAQFSEDGSGEVEEDFSVSIDKFWSNLIESEFEIDFENWDALDACNFVQCGVFGEIVYG